MKSMRIILSMFVLALVSCGPRGEGNSSPSSANQDTSNSEKAEIPEADPPSRSELIIGSWVAPEDVLGVPYELKFNEDGTYSQQMGESELFGTWKIEGDVLKVDNKHLRNGQVYSITELTNTTLEFVWTTKTGEEITVPMKRLIP